MHSIHPKRSTVTCGSCTFSTWLYDEGYTKRPRLDRLGLPKLPKPHVEVLAAEEIQKIIASINPDTFLSSRLLAMILIILDTGIRAGELVGMLMQNVDWERGVKVLHHSDRGSQYASASSKRPRR